MVGEAVEQGSGEPFRAKDQDPGRRSLLSSLSVRRSVLDTRVSESTPSRRPKAAAFRVHGGVRPSSLSQKSVAQLHSGEAARMGSDFR